MGTEAIGRVLGQQCAPVIAGVKPSNLLIVEKGSQSILSYALRGTDLHFCLLYSSETKDYWLIFEPDQLCAMLLDSEKRRYLRESGYDVGQEGTPGQESTLIWEDMSERGNARVHEEVLEAALATLAERFRLYKQDRGCFPHEMGVFLGYPLGDVKGFVENKGQNFKQSGYWKVYDDVAYANQIFTLYEYAKEKALELCGQGMRILDIWKCFRAPQAFAG